MKECPFCAEEIQDRAIKCKHCGSMLDALPGPSSVNPSTAPAPSSRELPPPLDPASINPRAVSASQPEQSSGGTEQKLFLLVLLTVLVSIIGYHFYQQFGSREIAGEIFIVRKDGENVRLGGVRIDLLRGDSVGKYIQEREKFSATIRQTRYPDDLRRRRNELGIGAETFDGRFFYGDFVTYVTSDANGVFKIRAGFDGALGIAHQVLIVTL